MCIEHFTVDEPIETSNPCVPSPCGSNAVCKEQNGAGSCTCITDYTGNPYEGCRPECVTSSDCSLNLACTNFKCKDPCPGTCGLYAQCQVINHLATCSCYPGYSGDPYRLCQISKPNGMLFQYFFIASFWDLIGTSICFSYRRWTWQNRPLFYIVLRT